MTLAPGGSGGMGEVWRARDKLRHNEEGSKPFNRGKILKGREPKC
jgi:hypothetical protein